MYVIEVELKLRNIGTINVILKTTKNATKVTYDACLSYVFKQRRECIIENTLTITEEIFTLGDIQFLIFSAEARVKHDLFWFSLFLTH